MGSTSIIVVAALSILGNILQFFLNKKPRDLKNLKDRLELMDEALGRQTKSFDGIITLQDTEIKELQKKIEKQSEILKQNGEDIIHLQKLIGKLIGNGCHLEECPNRSPYTMKEINEMTKNNKNEKNINRNKK